MLAAEFTGGYPSFGFAENTDDLFVGKTLLHGDVLMWLMKTLLTSGCTNQRGAGQLRNKQGTGHGRPWLPTIKESEAKAAIEMAGVISSYMIDKLSN
ncbi:TPA: abortive infection family protein [Klebsiella pneumoniae]